MNIMMIGLVYSLAELYKYNEEYNKAEACYKKTLEIYEYTKKD